MENKVLACVQANGERCKASTFSQRKKLKNVVSEEKYQEVLELIQNLRNEKSIVSENDFDEIDNGEIHEWYSVGDDKYGRLMYCLKTGIVRHQTMGEFYENTTVD